MSFSTKVKEEAAGIIPADRHCAIAETAAIFHEAAAPESRWDKNIIMIRTESQYVAGTFQALLRKLFHVSPRISVQSYVRMKKRNLYTVLVEDPVRAGYIRSALKLDREGHEDDRNELVPSSLIEYTCCRKAFLRGVFLTAGSLTDPEKLYHLEMVFSEKGHAEQVLKVMNSLGFGAKSIVRKQHHVVYLKEGDQIVDFLGSIEANVSLLNLESVRVYKDVRNDINRKVNCETANLNKTVYAGMSQIKDIEWISEHIGLDKLPDPLRSVAEARLMYPDASLTELGELLCPPLGKSGVNHRLRKLHEIAEEESL